MELRRSIGIAFADGGMLAVTAMRPLGAGAHGEEIVAAVLCDPDGAATDVAETLISTEYGPDGVPRRVTLELWTEDGAQPIRGGGTLIGARPVKRAGLDAVIGFFRWSMDGREGLGHYEVVREDG